MAEDLAERERVLARFQRKSLTPSSREKGATLDIDFTSAAVAASAETASAPNKNDTACDAACEVVTGYQAYKAVDRKQGRLQIRSATHASEWVPYSYLLRIVMDPSERHLALIFTFMAITISGHNLNALAEAVADERCEYIQEFAPRRWGKPAHPDAAFVESIEFIVDKSPMSAAEIEQEDAA